MENQTKDWQLAAQWFNNSEPRTNLRYAYVKEWREKRRLSRSPMIQDKIPPSKPCLKLVLLITARRDAMIQDEITLRRVASSVFAATGVSQEMIQDTMGKSP